MRKPSKCPANNKKMGKEAERRGKERKQKVKAKTAVSLLNTNLLFQNFAFNTCPNFRG